MFKVASTQVQNNNGNVTSVIFDLLEQTIGPFLENDLDNGASTEHSNVLAYRKERASLDSDNGKAFNPMKLNNYPETHDVLVRLDKVREILYSFANDTDFDDHGFQTREKFLMKELTDIDTIVKPINSSLFEDLKRHVEALRILCGAFEFSVQALNKFLKNGSPGIEVFREIAALQIQILKYKGSHASMGFRESFEKEHKVREKVSQIWREVFKQKELYRNICRAFFAEIFNEALK